MDSIENAMEVNESGCKPRKRIVDKGGWKREQEKTKRYSMKKLPKMPQCNHADTRLSCSTLNGRDAIEFSKSFYGSRNKIEQDKFILTCCTIKPPQRTNRKMVGSTLTRTISIECYIRKINGTMVRVCQSAFNNILNITRYRIAGICKRFLKNRTLPVETRGGDRSSTKYNDKKLAVRSFIAKFKVLQIHYCRAKNGYRQYLPGDLSVNKMYRMYMSESPNELRVKSSYFRWIFNRYFNLGFKAPSSDKCSTCLMYIEQLKSAIEPKAKSDIMVQKRVHTMRAKSFFHLAREEVNGMLTISFDCQKNMVLPKVPDQAAYYSRQLYFYNFGVVQGSARSSLNKENVFLYVWLENEHAKGSNEIASAMYHRLLSTAFVEVSVVRLICDGCGAQNKNSAIMGMLSFWLKEVAPAEINEVQIIFPVPGHSFIPPDRVFAQLEKKVRAKERIIKPEEYIDIYAEHGQIIRLGSDSCPVNDWKTATAACFKPPGQWHFQFNKAKRFIISKSSKDIISVRGEIAYRSDLGVAKSVLRKGKHIGQIKPDHLNCGVHVKQAKIDDVSKILVKHFGENWSNIEELEYYRSVIQSHQNVQNNNELTINISSECCAHCEEDLVV